jgi:hypothetical protein
VGLTSLRHPLVDEDKCRRASGRPQDTQGMKFPYPAARSAGADRVIAAAASEVAQRDNAVLQSDLGQLGALLVLLEILNSEPAVQRA